MKRGFGFWVLWVLAVLSMGGCAASKSRRDAAVMGGMLGALVGGGIGAGVGPQFRGDDDDNRAYGIAAGAVAGALIGGVIGYWLAEEEAPPPPPPPPAPTESKKIILRGINFDFDKANVKPEFAPVLDEAAQILQANPNVRVTIEGHTDSIGTAAYNQKLSERRAAAVKRYLVSKGVSANRLDTVGYGESRPIAPNKTPKGRDNPEGRAMNRRAELKVLQ